MNAKYEYDYTHTHIYIYMHKLFYLIGVFKLTVGYNHGLDVLGNSVHFFFTSFLWNFCETNVQLDGLFSYETNECEQEGSNQSDIAR